MVRLLKGKKPAEIIGKTVDDQKEPITVVVDSSGLTTTNRGSYIEDKWRREGRRKGSLSVKLHILADRKTGKIAGFRVTSEHTGDSKKFVPLVKEASKKKNKIAKVYGDTAYDARKKNFLLDELEIEPAIKIRKNARTLSRGSLPSTKRVENVLTNEEEARS
jgi:hypothetical protein